MKKSLIYFNYNYLRTSKKKFFFLTFLCQAKFHSLGRLETFTAIKKKALFERLQSWKSFNFRHQKRFDYRIPVYPYKISMMGFDLKVPIVIWSSSNVGKKYTPKGNRERRWEEDKDRGTERGSEETHKGTRRKKCSDRRKKLVRKKEHRE